MGFPTLENEEQKGTAKNTEESEQELRLPHPTLHLYTEKPAHRRHPDRHKPLGSAAAAVSRSCCRSQHKPTSHHLSQEPIAYSQPS